MTEGVCAYRGAIMEPDIIERLEAAEWPGEQKPERDARLILRTLLDEAAKEIDELRCSIERLAPQSEIPRP